MKSLFKNVGMYWKTMIAILVVLTVQALCDLALPGYTSDIVNIGIQQEGIDERIPDALTEGDMNDLLLFVGRQDADFVKSAYELKEKDTGYAYDSFVYVLKSQVFDDEQKMENLTDILEKPMTIMSGIEAGNELASQMEKSVKESMKQSIQAQGDKLPREQLEKQLGQIDEAGLLDLLREIPDSQRESLGEQLEESLSAMPQPMLDQSVILYIKTAYKGLNVDIEKQQSSYMFKVGAEMMGLAFLGMLASIIVGFLAARVGATAGRDLRGKVFRKVVGFSNNEFDHFSTASLITRSTNDIQQIQLLTVMLLKLVMYAPIMALGGIYKVFQTNVSMSWIIGLAVLLIGLVVLLLFTLAMPKFKVVQSLVDKLNLVTREILTGLPVIRAFSTERQEEKRFDGANRDLTKTNLFVNRAMTFMMPVMMLIMNGISVLIVWSGAHGINDGQMQVGDLMAFIQYTMQIIFSFLMLCMISIMLPRAAVAADRVQEVLTSKTIIHDPKEPKRLPQNLKGVLRFEHVSFRYPGASENVLQDINFEAMPGQTTAIIGSTGSGKSTLINLIPRFYDVTEGAVTLDGVDIRDISQHELRETLGYVPQKGVLFSGTIGSNILYGNAQGSSQEMVGAAEIAQASEFIKAKSEQYDSSIAQGGSNVSGGQKQRLSIARAIAKNPNIFIFDDSFSALDYKTDVALRKSLKEKTADSTVLIVAQRISTILHAEKIIVLDEGVIAGIGNHQELLRDCAVYQQIAASQLSEKELNTGGGNPEQAQGNVEQAEESTEQVQENQEQRGKEETGHE